MALPEIKTLLYTTSLGQHTRPVFRHAVKLASLTQARIIMLHVLEPLGEMGNALIRNYLPEEVVKKIHDEGLAKIHDTMQQRVEKFCAEELNNLAEPPQLVIEHRVAEGNQTDVILSVAKAEKADLIVMGAENRLGHHSHSTQQVIRHAKIPVLVVPTGKAFN